MSTKVLSGWLDEASAMRSLEIAIMFARYEASQSGALAASLNRLLDERDYQGLIDYELDYDAGHSVSDYIHARQCLAFFQKNTALTGLVGGNLEVEAWEKFLASERQCAETNVVFKSELQGNICFPPDVGRMLYAARWKIARILGDVPAFSALAPKLGPGASTTVKRRNACAAEKLAGQLACSINTAPWLPLIFGQNPHLFHQHAKYREELVSTPDGLGVDEVWSVSVEEHHGRLGFVEKDAKSKRTVVVEPSLSSFYQLGIGDIIADRLRMNGVSINDQTTNQNLARYGSVSNALATLDLSSASDTISKELVRFLLPEEWFSLLDGFRCPSVEYHGDVIELEKFSSMGNGFTFPLETLIFYALVWAASPHRERCFINAYGDDIVCGASNSDVVIRLLEFCGFTINKKKSFVDGPFRESCGADYFLGVNIRPYRLKRHVSGEVLFSIHNWYYRQHDTQGCELALSLIPPNLKIWGPDGYGDGHLLCPDPEMRIHKRTHGWGGYLFDTYTTVPRKSVRVHPGDFLQVLYSVYARGTPPETEVVENRGEGAMRMAPEPDSRNGGVVKSYPLPKKNRHYRRISIYTLSRS